MALMAGTTREESVVVSGAAVAAAPDPEVPGCPRRPPDSEGPGNRCSKLLTPWVAGARDHELQDRLASSSGSWFRRGSDR